MRLRWPRALVALFIVCGTAALGVGALGVGTAEAVTCGALGVAGSCPAPNSSTISASPGETGGATAIKTNWGGVATNGHIDSLTVTVTYTSPNGPAGAPRAPTAMNLTLPCATVAPSGGSQECDVAWPSETELNGFVLNGMYTLSISATTCPNDTTNKLLSCSSQSTAPDAIAVVRNVPKQPANVKATLGPANSAMVTWDPSPEPDVFAYAVRRSGLSTPIGGCKLSFAPADLDTLPACPVPLTVTDSTSGGGDFTYSVSAIRYGGSYAFADRVETAATSKKLTIPGPPASTVPGGGTGTAPGGGTGFGVFNAPKSKPGTTPTSGLIPKITPGIAPAAVTTIDPGFAPVLPYASTTDTTAKPTAAAGPAVPAPKGKNSVKSIALVGAGVLVTVIAMHGLWLRSEVRRSGALEVLEPEL